MTPNDKHPNTPETIKMMADEADNINKSIDHESGRGFDRKIEIHDIELRTQLLQAKAMIDIAVQLNMLKSIMLKQLELDSKVQAEAIETDTEPRSAKRERAISSSDEDLPESVPQELEDDVYAVIWGARQGIKNKDISHTLQVSWQEVKVACGQLKDKGLVEMRGKFPKRAWFAT